MGGHYVSFCVAFVRVQYALIFLPNVFFGLLGDDGSNVGDFKKFCNFLWEQSMKTKGSSNVMFVKRTDYIFNINIM
jgi:hypothetical protein